jgi:hypothetical protein
MTARLERGDYDTRWKDFRQFLWDVWTFLNLPAPTWVQLDIAKWLANPQVPKRFILEAFRGIGKSWMTVAFVLWLLYWNPQYKILVVSAGKDAAIEFTTFAFRLINEMPGLSHLAPRKGQRDSKLAFDVAEATPDKAPSVKSLGITSQLTGSRADIIVLDDIEIPSNSLTQLMRAKLAEQVKEFDAILKPVDHARVIVLGTPQCEQSVYNVLQTRGYIARIWPSRFPTEEECEEYGNRLAPAIKDKLGKSADAMPGCPTDPLRFTDLDLKERALSYGKAGYALQFQLRTRLSDAERFPIKVHDLIVMDCDKEKAPEKPIWCNDAEHVLSHLVNLGMNGDFYHRPMALVGQWLPYSGIVMAIDPSGRGKDETGYAVVAMLNGYLYVLACGGLQGGYDEAVLLKLVHIAKQYQVKHVVIEANFGDGMFEKLITPVFIREKYPVTTEEVKHSVQKEKRMLDTLEPVIQTHRLVMSSSVIEEDWKTVQGYAQEIQHQYSLIYQLTRLTREKGALAHDDRADVLSIAVHYWTEQMSADADTEQQAKKDADLDRELEKFMEYFTGVKHTELWSEFMR